MKTSASIGIDLGHSSVKISVKSGDKTALLDSVSIFPTVVRNWIQIANEDTAKKALVDTVEVNGKKFFIGKTAALQGQAENFSGQTRKWVETEQHDALLAGAWLRAMGVFIRNGLPLPKKISLVLGLPASYYVEQRSALRARAQSLIGKMLQIDQKLTVFVESQSRAPLLCVAFDAYGSETGRAGESESWGVIEIGHFTTDFTLHDRGQEVDDAASSASGTHLVYDNIATSFKKAGYLTDFETISTAIKSKTLKVFGKEIDVSSMVNPAIAEFATYIMDEISKRFGDKAQRLDGVIIAGGGSYIVGQEIMSIYPNGFIPTNPRFSVAEGYSRFGLLTLA